MSEAFDHFVTVQCPCAGIMIMTLNRPEKKNAINRAMYQHMVSVLENAKDNPDIKAVILTGKGETFTSGNDLADFAEVGLPSGKDATNSNPVLRFLDTYKSFPKPIIAAVQGDAVGIGTTLLLHSDLIYASDEATFSLPFVKLGLCPEFASSYILPRLVGHAKAFEWLVLALPFGASEAQQFGLINDVVSEPVTHALSVAKKLAALPPQAVIEAKRLIKSASIQAIDQSIDAEVQQFSHALKGAEFSEAVSAFFERREAKFD